jgi:hypothetical protein
MSWRDADQYGVYARLRDRTGPVYGRLPGQGSYFPGLDTTQQLFYQTDEGAPLAYARFMAGEADPTSYYSRWLGNERARVENAYKNASLGDINLQRTDFYDRQARSLYETYRNLPGWQQGQNPGVLNAGRRL